MAFTLQIATGISTPIYRQIVDQVKLAVASGELTAQDRLPSVRAVAEDLVVNPNTVARAFTDLVREGVLETQPGRGIFVAERRQRYSESERAQRLSRAVDRFVNEVALLGFTKQQLVARIEQVLDTLTLGGEAAASQIGTEAKAGGI